MFVTRQALRESKRNHYEVLESRELRDVLTKHFGSLATINNAIEYAESLAQVSQGRGAARGVESAIARSRQRLLSDPSKEVLKRGEKPVKQKPFYGTQWDAVGLMRSLRRMIVDSIGARGGVLRSVWFEMPISLAAVGHARAGSVRRPKKDSFCVTVRLLGYGTESGCALVGGSLLLPPTRGERAELVENWESTGIPEHRHRFVEMWDLERDQVREFLSEVAIKDFFFWGMVTNVSQELPLSTRFISDEPVNGSSDFDIWDSRFHQVAEIPDTIRARQVLTPLRSHLDRSKNRIGLYEARTWVAWRRHLALVMLADVLELIPVTNP
jgi:hypothetical protein